MSNGYEGFINIDPETGKEKVIEFGAKPWSIFGPSARVNVHFLKDEGWCHSQEYPYGSSMWGDKTDYYDKGDFRVMSSDYHSSVIDMRKPLNECPYMSYPYHSFNTVEQLRVLLDRLSKEYYSKPFRIWEEKEFTNG